MEPVPDSQMTLTDLESVRHSLLEDTCLQTLLCKPELLPFPAKREWLLYLLQSRSGGNGADDDSMLQIVVPRKGILNHLCERSPAILPVDESIWVA